MIVSSILYLIFSGIGMIISIVPLYWHLEAANVGTCMFMIWTLLVLFTDFVGAIVWNGNAINWAPVWCDIVVRIRIAVILAWPACVLCIVRRLYFIATTTTVTATHTDKRRQLVVDLLITVAVPLLFSLAQLINAGHRGNIFENYNCQPTTYNSPVAFFLVWIWPLIFSLVSATYGLLTVRAFMKRRKQFKDLVASTGMTWNRYRRLVMLAFADLFFTIPLSIWGIVSSAILIPLSPWISWADTHSNFDRYDQFPWVLMQPVTIVELEVNRWSAVLAAFVFFGFFGFADEAKKNYRLFVSTVTKRLGATTFSQSTAISDSMVKSGTGSKGGVSLPVYITQQVESKRDSFDSFSDKLSTSITVGEYELKVQPYSPTEQSTSSSSSSVISPEVHQVPQTVLDPASARKPSVPDAPKSVHPDNAFDQV